MYNGIEVQNDRNVKEIVHLVFPLDAQTQVTSTQTRTRRTKDMGTFTQDQADQFVGQGGINFFQLKNDKEHAHVRFLYNDICDVQGYSGHEVEINGKTRFVNCLRDSNDQPIDDCPFCQAGYKTRGKIFVPLFVINRTVQDKYDPATKKWSYKTVNVNQVEIWEKGPMYFSELSDLCARYNPTVSFTLDLTRNGAAGYQRTTYTPHYVGQDQITLQELPEAPQILGSFLLLDKSYEEMFAFLETGVFPQVTDQVPPPPAPAAAPPRNPAAPIQQQRPAAQQMPQRRTPSNVRPGVPQGQRPVTQQSQVPNDELIGEDEIPF